MNIKHQTVNTNTKPAQVIAVYHLRYQCYLVVLEGVGRYYQTHQLPRAKAKADWLASLPTIDIEREIKKIKACN